MIIEMGIAALFGLLFGSFLNVCISRLPDEMSVVTPGSHCPRCGTPIRAWQNIPILSFLILRGRCQTCKLPISWRYPVVELLTAGFFAWSVWHWGVTWAGFKGCLFAFLMLGCIFSDLETRLLPDEFTIGGTLAGILLSPLGLISAGFAPLIFREIGPPAASLVESMLGAVAMPLLLWSIGEVYLRLRGREGLGFGDVKLIACIGAFTGLYGAVLTLMLGSLSGAVLGVLWIRVRGHNMDDYPLPFGVFLGAAGLAALFCFPV